MDCKTCTKCKTEKPLTDFGNKKAAKDGKKSQCKSCRNAANRERKEAERNRPKVTVESKTCNTCGETYPASEFPVNNGNRDGLFGDCKVCKNAKSRAYDAKDGRARVKASYHRNKHKHLDKRAAYREEHRDEANAYFKEYRKKHSKKRSVDARLRDKRVQAVTAEEDKPLLKQIQENRPEGYHVDHIWPLVKGGLNTPANLCYLPASVNLRKKDKLPEGKTLHDILLKHAILPATMEVKS